MLDTVCAFFESKGIKILKQQDRRLEVEFPLGDGRTRVLDFLDLGDLFEIPILRVAAAFRWAIKPETLIGMSPNLLSRNQKMKVGHFAVMDAGDNEYMLFLQHELCSDKPHTQEVLAVAVQVATAADDFEREVIAGASSTP